MIVVASGALLKEVRDKFRGGHAHEHDLDSISHERGPHNKNHHVRNSSSDSGRDHYFKNGIVLDIGALPIQSRGDIQPDK
jgi:hypothetical protein